MHSVAVAVENVVVVRNVYFLNKNVSFYWMQQIQHPSRTQTFPRKIT